MDDQKQKNKYEPIPLELLKEIDAYLSLVPCPKPEDIRGIKKSIKDCIEKNEE